MAEKRAAERSLREERMEAAREKKRRDADQRAEVDFSHLVLLSLFFVLFQKKMYRFQLQRESTLRSLGGYMGEVDKSTGKARPSSPRAASAPTGRPR